MLLFNLCIIFRIVFIVVMFKHLAMTQIIIYMSTQYQGRLVVAWKFFHIYGRRRVQCNFGHGWEHKNLTGISSLSHLKLVMWPKFLLFVIPHQQEQVHSDKSSACDVVSVQPNLGFVPCTLIICHLVCLCAGTAGDCIQLLQCFFARGKGCGIGLVAGCLCSLLCGCFGQGVTACTFLRIPYPPWQASIGWDNPSRIG